MNLADQLSAYAVKLLDKARGHKELDCVLGENRKRNRRKICFISKTLFGD